MGNGLALADEAAVASTMDAAFEEQLKEGAEAFEFQAEVRSISRLDRYFVMCCTFYALESKVCWHYSVF